MPMSTLWKLYILEGESTLACLPLHAMQSSTSNSSRSSHSTEGGGVRPLFNVDWARHSSGVVSVGEHDQMGINVGADSPVTVPSPYDANDTRQNRHRKGAQKQNPGKTAANNERHYVQHNYHDLLNEPDSKTNGYSQVLSDDSFPMKLHRIFEEVEKDGYAHIMSWQPHGRAFVIRDATLFSRIIMPKYFPTSKKYSSIQRQFNIYGFEKLTRDGPDKGSYYHEAFLRGRPELTSRRMVRRRIKGTGHKACSNPDAEPDFYAMPFVTEIGSDISISANGAHSIAPAALTLTTTLDVERSVTREESDQYSCQRSLNQQRQEQPALSLLQDTIQDFSVPSSHVQTYDIDEDLLHFDWSDPGISEKTIYSV